MSTDHYLSIIEDDRYRQAELLLNRRVSASARRLSERLEVIRRQHDLTWTVLLDSHHEIQRMVNHDMSQPSIWHYWEESAHPQSTPLFEAATTAIDEEIPHFSDAVTRFVQTTRRLSKLDGLVTTTSVDRALDSGRRAGLDPTLLNEIGQRWQKRLHRKAVRKAATRVIMQETSKAELLIMQAEMELLDTAPWAHMDRLLMAFELTHSDVRTHLRDRLDNLVDDTESNERSNQAQRVGQRSLELRSFGLRL